MDRDRYSRQEIFPPIGRGGQERLRSAKALVVGCGAIGSRAAEQLARAGIGLLRLVDRDTVEISNLHRAGFTEADARDGAPKACALAARLREVNREVTVDPRAEEFRFTTALALADGVDVILDGSDNLPTRFLLNDVSIDRGIPWIYAGVLGDTGHAQFFRPPDGPCLRCILRDVPPPGELPTCEVAGVIGPAVAAIASFQAAMALRYLSGGPGEVPALIGRQVRIGVWTLTVAISTSRRDPGCPACGRRDLEFLGGRAADAATVLCGRGAVQVTPVGLPGRLDLPALAARLRALGAVEEGAGLIRFRTTEGSMTVFADGRAIVDGNDPGRARAFYARYVGQ